MSRYPDTLAPPRTFYFRTMETEALCTRKAELRQELAALEAELLTRLGPVLDEPVASHE